jgi:hypothetical protein
MFSFRKFWSYCGGIVIHPQQTIRQVIMEEKKVAYGLAAVLLLSILYSIAVLISWAKGGAPSGYEPFLRIPTESYYFWQTFFTVPVGLIGWIFFAGSTQLLSKKLSGQGSFEENLAVLGFPYILMLPFSWLPEFICIFLSHPWVTAIYSGAVTAIRVGISLIWFAAVSIVAIKKAQRLSTSRASLAAIVSLIPTIGLQMTYLH